LFVANGEATRINPNATSSSPVVTASATSSQSSSSDSTSTGTKVGIGVGVSLGVIAIIGLVGIFFFLRRRQQNSQEMDTPEMKQQQFEPGLEYDESLAPPSTMYSRGHHRAESAELDSQTSMSVRDRYSYLSYRAPGFQDGPVELPSEATPPGYRQPELP
jgi:Cortical protein marker for cell polarity